MSQALVSGRAAMAFIRESDEKWLLLRYEKPDNPVPCPRSEVARHLNGCNDVQQLANADLDGVRDSLFDAVDLTEATDLTLWLLDDRLSDETRAAASSDLDELLGYSELREMWTAVFWARPLPARADLGRAIAIARSVNAARVTECLSDLQAGQTAISAVRLAWDRLSREPEYFGESAREIEAMCIRNGIFREFAIAHRDGRLDDALFRWAPDPEARRRCPKWVNACNAWKQALSSRPVAARTKPFAEPVEVFEDDEDGPRQKQKGYDRAEILKKIKSQKQLILKCLDQGDENRAARLVDELVAYQLEYGGPSFAAKSLCDLAQRAYERDLVEIHRRLSERSVELDDSDGWAWTQYGHALRLSGEYEKALDAYRHAEEFGQREVGKTGRAEVLKALERYDDALAAYEEAIRLHPADAFAKTGRAEVLKALERYDDALAAYEEAIRLHPADAVAKTGRAEVLKALERYDDALAAYEEAIRLYPADAVAKNGRAEVLKALERYDDALAAYEEAIRLHPADAVAKNGRAEVLKALERYDGALAAYEEAIRLHPADAVAKNGRAEVLKALERYDDALAAYEETIRLHPADVFARTGRWAVLMEMGKAEQVWGETANLSLNSSRWINQHIRAIAALRTHRFAEARSLLTEGLAMSPKQRDRDYYRSGLAILHLREKKFQEASVELSMVSSPSMRGPRLVLDAHVAGALMNSSRVEELLGQVANLHGTALKDVCTELRHRYVLRLPDVHSDDWLLEREIRMCGLAA